MNTSRFERFAQTRASSGWLSVTAFFNSFLIPAPAEILLVPLCVACPRKSWWYASVATIASVLGGLTGYAIGAFLFTTLGAHIVDYYGTQAEFEALVSQFNHTGAEWILLATISPLPYKLVTVTSGVAQLSLTIFVTASLLGRMIGYFSIAVVCWHFGDRARHILGHISGKVFGLLVLLVGGILLLR